MNLPLGLAKTLREMSDEEVFAMVARGAGYVPDALEAARVELARRNLSSDTVAAFEASYCADELAAEDRAKRPLPWVLRVINFLLPLGIPQMTLAGGFGAKGYTRRERECWSWMWRGVAFYVLTFLSGWGLLELFVNGPTERDMIVCLAISAVLSVSLVIGVPVWVAKRKAKSRHGAVT